MEMHKLNSSNILSVGYDRKAAFLRVEFRRKEGSVFYIYPDIPSHVFYQLLNADSPGKYFNQHVRGQPFIKEGED
jgi:hypothetical protein